MRWQSRSKRRARVPGLESPFLGDPLPLFRSRRAGFVPLVHPKILIAFGAALSRALFGFDFQSALAENLDQLGSGDFTALGALPWGLRFSGL
jgi:hypothetical protein